ncbi:MAG: HD-GYP domain-containing protein [Clostridia bacterium]
MDHKKQIHQKNNYIVLVIAVVLFAVTFALGIAADSLITKLTDKNYVTDWRFVSADDPESLEGDDVVFKQATASKRAVGSVLKPYMRLQYDIAPHEEDFALRMTTKFSPLKAVLDGQEIYNNGYLKLDYTGNQFSSVAIPASDRVQMIDLYLYTPFGFELDAALEAPAAGASLFEIACLSLGIAVILAGIALMIVSFTATTKSRSVLRMVFLSSTVIICGLLVLLQTTSAYSARFSGQIWFRLQLAVNMVLMSLLFINIMVYYEKKSRKCVVLSLVMLGSIGVALFLSSSLLLQIILSIFAVAHVLFIVFILEASNERKKKAIHMTPAIKVLLLYIFFLNFYNILSCILGTYFINHALIALGTGVALFSLFAVYMKGYVVKNIKEEARRFQIETDSVWIDDISNLISNIYTQEEEKEFFAEVANGVKALVVHDSGDNEFENIKTCVAVYDLEDASYQEIYNSGDVENCDYRRIEKELTQNGKNLFIGSSYIEMLFRAEDHPNAVVYLEGLNTRHAANLENIMHTVYDNVSSAYKNLSLQHDMTHMREDLFINMAAVLEMRFDGTGTHLIIVSQMVETLCLTLGYEPGKARLIASASTTHDIGKIAVPESILSKKGKLTEEEHKEMEKHVWYGRNILSVTSGEFFEIARAIAFEHHENYDGTGYFSKTGNEISIYGRIVRVADVFDALLSKRSYKPAWTFEDASAYIISGKGTLFDPAVVDAFTQCKEKLYDIKISFEEI